jgi:catechol 2,3-dioxygenase-like lactoylglutathione lyase family enzyme
VEEAADGTLTVALGRGSSPLALRPWDAVAGDAGVAGESRGFRGFTLSYIVDTAEAVDDVLAGAERHGGVVSKPPKSALWGYSAYVTDPSGHLWKIASAKRRPLLARGRREAPNGPVEPSEVPLTIGVADMDRAKAFYRDALGLPVKKDYRKFVMFEGVDGTSPLGMYRREALADDAAVAPDGGGFHGFTLTRAAGSRSDAEAVLERAARAGASIARDGSGFADPDGNVWRVVSAPAGRT